MLRFRIGSLLREREEAEGRVISWREVSETNTRYLDALCRYFRVTPGEILELYPPLDQEPRSHIDELYPGGRRPPPAPRPGQ